MPEAFCLKMKQYVRNLNVICGIFVLSYILSVNGNGMPNEEGSCQSFAGGTVYPQGTDKSDHKLQWTKAVSKYENVYDIFQS